MRTIVHLSDLHFGALDEAILPPLLESIVRVRPDLVAISGDLTQRARRSQFQRARAWLDRLPGAVLVVPGNHDVPLFNLAARLLDPLASYRRFITGDLAPVFADEEIVVVGLNSTRSTLFMRGRGRLNECQVRAASSRIELASPGAARIIVTHHPFDLPAGHDEQHLIGGARMAMGRLAIAGADVFLAGHLHVSHLGHTAERYQIAGHSALVVQAGTLSRRGRGELNSYNVLRIERSRLQLDRYSWDDPARGFAHAWTGTFERTAAGWQPAAGEEAP